MTGNAEQIAIRDRMVASWNAETTSGDRNGSPEPEPARAEPTESDSDPVEPPPGEHGDVANAQSFLDDHRQRFRYFAATRRWLVYADGVWSEDHDRVQARVAAELSVRGLLVEAANEPDRDRAGVLIKRAQRSMTATRLAALLEVAEPHIAVAAEDLDRDPWLLNCTNVVVDLRTGTTLAHDPDLLLTRQAGAAYLPGVTATSWERFLTQILPDPEVRAYLKRLVGSFLVGEQRDHILPILYGTGANGKSTAVGAIGRVMGTYAHKITVDVLVGRGVERASPSPELVKLRGRRLAVADEPEAGARLRESHVKALTGGDNIVARPLYADPIEFAPSHTLALVTNHRPEVAGTDEGIWRRLALLPFTVTIADDDQDKELPMKLAAEADAILGWAIDGCLEWQEHGLDPPEAVRAATREYRAEQDHVSAFIEDACLVSQTVKVQVGDLRAAYERWCAQNGIDPLSATAFGTELTERGHPTHKGAQGRRYRDAIALLAAWDEVAGGG